MLDHGRKIKVNLPYRPFALKDGNECIRIGIMKLNISQILTDISSNQLMAEKVDVQVVEWFKWNFRKHVNEEHMPYVQLGKPIVMAEIRPGMYSVIDGNHRMERAYRDEVETVEAFRLKGEQLLPYFTDSRGYETFVEYWNSKVEG